jgi:hypothetical protein
MVVREPEGFSLFIGVARLPGEQQSDLNDDDAKADVIVPAFGFEAQPER